MAQEIGGLLVVLADGAKDDRLNHRGSSEVVAVDVEVGSHHPSYVVRVAPVAVRNRRQASEGRADPATSC